MAVLLWRLMGAHGLFATFTVDVRYEAFIDQPEAAVPK
jgi:hypothetical protein